MNLWFELILIVLAWLLGSVPFGYIFTRYFTGKNILEIGSGNIGSTNVGRIAGKKISLLTQVCDMLKGLLPVFSVHILEANYNFHFEQGFIYGVALAAILGHDFSVFLKFKGGKGVNTTLGASLLIAPYSVLFAVLLYYGIKWRYKIVSLGSIGIAISLPITDLMIHHLSLPFYYLCVASLLIIFRHISNIKRLLNRTENHL
jgi:glycerol-3-phosphate acyltransferase PlsY